MTAGGISDRVRAVIAAAEAQAHELGHHAIAPAHLLLGLLIEETTRSTDTTDEGLVSSNGLDGLGLLAGTGLVLAAVRDAVVRHADTALPAVHRPGDHRVRGGWGSPALPVSAQARGVLQQALRRATPHGETTSGDRQVIVPAHLLLGVLDSDDTVCRRALTDLAADTSMLTAHAERAAAPAPMLARPAPQSPGRVPVRVDGDGHAVFSIFGWSSRLRLDGPAARQVLARAGQVGELDVAELHAAAEADAAHRSRHQDPDQAR